MFVVALAVWLSDSCGAVACSLAMVNGVAVHSFDDSIESHAEVHVVAVFAYPECWNSDLGFACPIAMAFAVSANSERVCLVSLKAFQHRRKVLAAVLQYLVIHSVAENDC